MILVLFLIIPILILANHYGAALKFSSLYFFILLIYFLLKLRNYED